MEAGKSLTGCSGWPQGRSSEALGRLMISDLHPGALPPVYLITLPNLHEDEGPLEVRAGLPCWVLAD